MRTVTVTRYVTPLREGGSVPAIVEADDLGVYVLKFRGAAQGVKVLIAELLAGEIARTLGLPAPEVVLAELDPVLGRAERDPEIQTQITASGGLNLALDYLPGSFAFDVVTTPPTDPDLASAIVWFDAYISNVDRTPRNTNMLVWHKRVYLIDHGAALNFHFNWPTYRGRVHSAFPHIKDHVLLPFATRLAEADDRLSALLTPEALERIAAQIPGAWLADEPFFASAADCRAAYLEYLTQRLAGPRAFVEEAIHAHARLL